ncbi:MAG: hypothetical protein PVH82_13555, partial [Desulfobacteraceae bacterium]
MGCKDRWKPRYAGIPRLRLGNNGKPWRTKISLLIYVPQGFLFFQAIRPTQFLEYQRNLRNLWIRIRVHELFQQKAIKSVISCASCLI